MENVINKINNISDIFKYKLDELENTEDDFDCSSDEEDVNELTEINLNKCVIEENNKNDDQEETLDDLKELQNLTELKPLKINEEEYMYADKQPSLRFADKKILCVGIQWNGKPDFQSASQSNTMAYNVKKFYERNSRGLVTFTIKGIKLSVPLKAKRTNLQKVKNIVKYKYPDYDFYILVHLLKGASNASGGIAYVNTKLYSVAEHEVGHLLGLGHAGSYGDDKTLDVYGDATSVMSKYPSSFLTAPQYYYLGWFDEKEVAIYQPNKIYTLKKLGNYGQQGIFAVYVKGEAIGNKRGAFLSYPITKKEKNVVALHLSSKGGSSQLVKFFGNDYTDKRFTNLTIKILDKNDFSVNIQIFT